MNNNMTRFIWFSKIFAFLRFKMKVALALEGLNNIDIVLCTGFLYFISQIGFPSLAIYSFC